MMTGVAPTQVWRILHTSAFYPYHLQRVQHFLAEDLAPPVQYCEWLQAHLDIFLDILFMGESHFTCGGINSTQNSHSWVHENPHIRTLFSVPFFCECVVCCVRLGNYITGPHFMKGCLTSAYFRDFLQNDLPLYLEDVLLATQGECGYNMIEHHHILAERKWSSSLMIIMAGG
jgi:hypothetical protein